LKAYMIALKIPKVQLMKKQAIKRVKNT